MPVEPVMLKMLEINSLLKLFLFIGLNGWTTSTEFRFDCDASCVLPYCYCMREHVPNNLNQAKVPQMILFTFTDVITETIREDLTTLFPDKAQNPNGCPIGITIFAEFQSENQKIKGEEADGSPDEVDPCPLHRLYVRGHEVAFSSPKPSPTIRKELARKFYMLDEEITGGRVEDMDPNGDAYFKLLANTSVIYDSSLVYEDHIKPIWPFTLNKNLNSSILGENSAGDFRCSEPVLTGDCPRTAHGLWEVPVDALYSSRLGIYCEYLDNCASGLKTSDDVHDLLVENLARRVRTNRAPMMVNLKQRSLSNSITFKGLYRFVRDMTRSETDLVWLVTLQDALKWMKSPSNITESYSLWSCNDLRRYSKNCTILMGTNKSYGNLSDLFDVTWLWLYQLIFFAMVYIYLIYRERNLEKFHDQ